MVAEIAELQMKIREEESAVKLYDARITQQLALIESITSESRASQALHVEMVGELQDETHAACAELSEILQSDKAMELELEQALMQLEDVSASAGAVRLQLAFNFDLAEPLGVTPAEVFVDVHKARRFTGRRATTRVSINSPDRHFRLSLTGQSPRRSSRFPLTSQLLKEIDAVERGLPSPEQPQQQDSDSAVRGRMESESPRVSIEEQWRDTYRKRKAAVHLKRDSQVGGPPTGPLTVGKEPRVPLSKSDAVKRPQSSCARPLSAASQYRFTTHRNLDHIFGRR